MSKVSEADLAEARAQYERDGATVLRGALSRERINEVGDALDRFMHQRRTAPDFLVGEDLADPGSGRFFNSNFAYLRVPEIRSMIFDSDLARYAGAIMQASKVRFFYDQVLVKEPGTANRTPWHQDLPYYPVCGEHVLSFWVAIDRATPENGVVTYVKGSHRWDRFFAMQPFAEKYRERSEQEAGATIYDDAETIGQPRNLADIRRNPQNYEFLSWDVEPGDVIVHHPLVIHGADGNSTSGMRRRAIATRWFGDKAYWDDSRPNFMRALKGRSDFPFPELAQGEQMIAPIFPLVWERDRPM